MKTLSNTRQTSKSSQISLTSFDVNAISTIIQQRTVLPNNFLIQHAIESKMSPDAIEIVKLLLSDDFTMPVKTSKKSITKNATKSKNDVKKEIAYKFYQWASDGS